MQEFMAMAAAMLMLAFAGSLGDEAAALPTSGAKMPDVVIR